MTAEIAVANKSAIALAADSKVTIGGGRNAKTYDSVNKVFTLSKTCPVGIMIFGNAEFMGYPWETVIKLYRRDRGSAEKEYVRDWSEDFQDYISKFGYIAPSHRDENIESILTSWLFELENLAAQEALEMGIPRPSDQYDNILVKVIERYTNILGVSGPWLSRSKSKSLLKNYGEIIVVAISGTLGADVGTPLYNAASKFAISALVMQRESPQSSGFVIAGFGSKEYFPTVIEHHTDGFVGNNLKIRSDSPHDISRSNPGYIGAFAQKDTVQNFMNGYDPGLIQGIAGGFSKIMTESCLDVLDNYGLKSNRNDKVRKAIEKAAGEAVKELVSNFAQESRERFSGPIVEMVSLLPKDELAHLAESLVSLTSLRRRVSREIETVGGPIDVALISKGDGFVWIRRKQYFRADLNPQFVRNYMDDAR